jgi:hypothetical protein
MSDFIVPYPPFRDRRSPSGPGLRTILGNASPLSPQWDYARERAAEADDTGFRGAPNVEPAPDSPEYQNASLEVLGNAAGAPPPSGPIGQMASIAIPMSSGLADATLGQTLKSIGARLAPASGGILAGGTVLLTPRNTPATTYDLGDGFRAQSAPGQRSVSIERRVNDGLLGTGVGAKWEPLDVDAEMGPGPDGIVRLKINPDQLKSAVGDDVANRVLGNSGGKNDLPPPPLVSRPSKIEMRIGVLINGNAETERREASQEDVLSVCPNYPTYERIGIEAAERYKAAGMVNGTDYGQRVHGSLETMLKMHEIQSSLHERGIFELKPELALLNGVKDSYTKGSSRLDVVELHDDHVTVCVYELKTGRARIRDETIDRYLREASLYAKAQQFGYPNVYFIPIRVP